MVGALLPTVFHIIGVLTGSHADFGNSWLVPGMECSAQPDDTHPCDLAGYEVKKEALEKCSIIQVRRTLPLVLFPDLC